ncbi:GNAT family N-acetyltransferase [Shewanella psychrotolerans]|uniref:GNAT family N-acetyltransferase n=1 Tax=Shewanella psychrotolerans TaxID=2864206 RepID=UPI001C65E17D|nr:GNAT family N-acetyltransferase [Shewanella psychrotolerans]QYK00236.1 GNAT family N-acetyltransferase [Shewanella psychrotolerans]
MLIFISRDLDVFQSEFDLSEVSSELARDFENLVLADITQCKINDVEYLRWVMVAVEDENPIGYCYFRHHIKKSVTYIGQIYVDKEARGKAIARKLLNMSLDFSFSLLPNQVEIHFTTKELNSSKLVDLFFYRAMKQKRNDKFFDIKATAFSSKLELVT